MVGILEDIFELQIAFQKFLGNNFHASINSKENIELIKNQTLAIIDEVMESLREIPWKPWKNDNLINLKKYRIELIDIFHFLINLFLLAGMTPQMVWDYFKEKNDINIRRQKDGY